MNGEKKFVAPLAEVVDFNNDDIITLSNKGTLDTFDNPDAETWSF